MILVDTNVLMDVFAADPKWADWSIARLDEWSRRGPLFVAIFMSWLHNFWSPDPNGESVERQGLRHEGPRDRH